MGTAQQRTSVLGAVLGRNEERIRSAVIDEYEFPLQVFGELADSFLRCLGSRYTESG